MGFWIFMLVCNLLVPFVMIGFGKYFIKSAPKEINTVFGYRTTMSMKNKDTWSFARHYCGKLWRLLGWISLAVTIVGNEHTPYSKKMKIFCYIGYAHFDVKLTV